MPHIALIKRVSLAGLLRDALVVFAGAYTAVFLASMALVVINYHPLR